MAKYRFGFVSNSSSSSFIIARTKDCTQKDIETMLRNHLQEVKDFVNGDLEYCEDSNEFENLNTEEEKIELAIKKLASEFNNLSKDMTLDNWLVTAEEFGNESGNMLALFVYDCLYDCDDEKIKIAAGDN
jgi:hypothetical protein